jgi:hypothetical protein
MGSTGRAARAVLALAMMAIGLCPFLGGGRALGSLSVGSRRVTVIPPRPAGAITGSEFARRTDGLHESERQTAALEELRRGNVPSFLRNLQPLSLGQRATGRPIRATAWVMPDYLAIGSDKDFLRIPLTLPSAMAIANQYGFVLPTPRMVDEIYRQAAIKLQPQPLPAGAKMCSSEFYLLHQRMVQEQLGRRPEGALIAGHKKDVVISKRLLKRPGKIAIYGWHRLNGQPIQPLSTVHEATYADYSHGIRLVSAMVLVDGQPRSIFDMLPNEELAQLLTDEGAISEPRSLMRLSMR